MPQVDDIVATLLKMQEDLSNSKSGNRAIDTAIGSLSDNCQALAARVAATESAVPALEKDIRRSCETVENKILSRLASVEQSFRDESKSTHSNIQQVSTTLSTLSGTVSTLNGTVQVLQDRYEVTQGTLKDNKATQAKLESSVLQNQKDLNTLQYQFSKMQSEAQHGSSGASTLILADTW